jgi:hypothetical protein
MDLTRREALAMAALIVPGLAAAAEPNLEVPYVPTPPELVERMLDLAAATAASSSPPAGAARMGWASTSIPSGSTRPSPPPATPASAISSASAARICSAPRSTRRA